MALFRSRAEMDPPHPTRVLLLDSGLEGLDANNETTVDGDPAAAAAHPEPSATTAPAVDNGGGGGYLAVATEPAPSGDSSDDELPAYDNVGAFVPRKRKRQLRRVWMWMWTLFFW